LVFTSGRWLSCTLVDSNVKEVGHERDLEKDYLFDIKN
jgi:hypothetical protein